MYSLTNGLGDRILALVENAQLQAFLVAPFIKVQVVEQLLAAAPASVSGTIVTRWRAEEVAAGVSDLEVLDEVSKHPGWTLRLCHRLHAKYYRVDARALIGSANLTQTALGWRQPSNLELLFEVPRQADTFGRFEAQLIRESVPASYEIRDAVSLAARSLEASIAMAAEGVALSEAGPIDHLRNAPDFLSWLPFARNPGDIAYVAKNGASDLSTAAADQVSRDYHALNLPNSLPPSVVADLVRSRLAQHPLILRLNDYAVQPRRFGEMSSFVERWLRANGIPRDSDEAWQTLMRWLLHFFPGRYERSQTRFTEVFQVRRGDR